MAPFDVISPLQPEHTKYPKHFHGFCAEMLQEAQRVVRTCPGYSNIVPTLQAIMGENLSPVPESRSTTTINEIARVQEILRAHMTDVRPSCEYRTGNPEYASHGENFTKMWTVWYYNRGIDQKFGSVVDYASACASGYAHQQWNFGIDDIDVTSFDGRDFLPLNPFDTTVQSCWGGFLKRFVPLPWAQSMFPHMAAQLEADATYESPNGLPGVTRDSIVTQSSRTGPFFSSMEGSEAEDRRARGVQGVHLYWFYFNDPTINTSGDTVFVGDWERDDNGKLEALTNYSYRVGPKRPKWPRKRLAIFSKSGLCYDGPNHYWHGMFPISKYTMIPYPWTWLGATPLWMCLGLQESLTFALRVLDDHVRRLIRPPVSGGPLSTDDELRKLSEMMALPGAFWRNLQSNGIKVEEIKPLDAMVMGLIEFCLKQIPQRIGIDPVDSLLKLNQMPEGDTMEKLLYASGTAMRLRSRMIELFYREQGRMFAFNAMQFYSVRRKFLLLGREGITPTDYDHDPSTFIPRLANDDRDPVDIATEFGNQFDFYVGPSSLLRSAAIAEQGSALALFRLGALSRRTLLEKMDYQNITKIMRELDQEWQQKIQLAQAMKGAAEGGGGALPPGVGPKPMGGDPRGRDATGIGPPKLGGDSYVRQ